MLQTLFTTPQTAICLVDLLERILFPLDGYLAPTPEDPTEAETTYMRRSLEQRISEVVPGQSAFFTLLP